MIKDLKIYEAYREQTFKYARLENIAETLIEDLRIIASQQDKIIKSSKKSKNDFISGYLIYLRKLEMPKAENSEMKSEVRK